MKRKIAGVSVWIWSIGFLLLAAVLVFVLAPGSQDPKGIDASEQAASGRDKLAEVQGRVFDDIKAVNVAIYDERYARENLRIQTTAGGAELMGIDYSEKKEILKAAKVKVEDSFAALQKAETKFGSPEGSLYLRNFEMVSYRTISDYFYSKETKGITNQGTRDLFNLVLHYTKTASFEDVMKGSK